MGNAQRHDQALNVSMVTVGGIFCLLLLIAPLPSQAAEALNDRIEGNVLYQSGDLDGAVQKYKNAIEKEKTAVGWNNLGVALLKKGDFSEARKALERALVLDQQNPYIYFNIGIAYHRVGDKILAAWAFESAVYFKPDFERAKRNMELLKK